jgi:hypothetical protein
VVLHQSGVAERAVDAGGADGDDIGVEHHEGQPPVAFPRMAGVEVEDRFLLPLLQPPIAGDRRVVLVGQAVPGAPVAELSGGDSEPRDEPLSRLKCLQIRRSGNLVGRMPPI